MTLKTDYILFVGLDWGQATFRHAAKQCGSCPAVIFKFLFFFSAGTPRGKIIQFNIKTHIWFGHWSLLSAASSPFTYTYSSFSSKFPALTGENLFWSDAGTSKAASISAFLLVVCEKAFTNRW